MDYSIIKKQLENKNIVFLDLWGTVFLEKNTNDLNLKRAEVLNTILNNRYETYYLKEQIEQNIISFKKSEKNGRSISAFQRIENIFKSMNLEYESSLIDKVVEAFDKLYFNDFKPIINTKLLDLISSKKIILVSNTGMVTSKCIDRLLEFYNIENIFYKRYYSDRLLYCKPNPIFLKKIIEDNSLVIKDCIYIGDSYEMDYPLCLKLNVDYIIEKWEIKL